MGAALQSLKDLPDWPRWLSAEQAAAYVGVSENQFKADVEAGLWPKAQQRRRRVLWDRKALDEASDRISGLGETLSVVLNRPRVLKDDWSKVGANPHGQG